jgi:hypothetical protein
MDSSQGQWRSEFDEIHIEMAYLKDLNWDDAINKNPNVFIGFDIFKIREGYPGSRN